MSLLNYRASHKTNIEGILNNLLHQTTISLQYRLIPELNSCAWGMHCSCSSLLAGCRASSSGLRLLVLSHGQGVPHKSVLRWASVVPSLRKRFILPVLVWKSSYYVSSLQKVHQTTVPVVSYGLQKVHSYHVHPSTRPPGLPSARRDMHVSFVTS